MITATEEWSELAAEWQSVKGAELVARTLIAHAETHVRRMRWLIPVEVGITVGMLSGLAVWLRARPSAWPWALYALFFAAGICTFSVWNRRGTWAASANTNAAYLALAVLRYRRQLRAARFTVLVTGTHLLAAAVWFLVRDVPPGRTLRAFALIAVYAVAYGAAAWSVHTRARRELAGLEERFGREEPLP